MAGGKIQKKRHQPMGGGIPFEKSKGQHILKNPMLVETIVQKSGIKPTDVVLEIGPGTGNLTKKLLEVAKSIIVIELDPRIQAPMMTRLRCSLSRLTTAPGISFQGMTQLMHIARNSHANAVRRLLATGAP